MSDEKKQSVLHKTLNGKIYTCGYCDLLHVEFGNISVKLNKKEFEIFIDIVNKIEPMKPKEDMFSKVPKFAITLYHKNCSMLISEEERKELKDLLNFAKNALDINAKGISSDCCLN